LPVNSDYSRCPQGETSPAEDSKLPTLRLKDGFSLNRALGEETWILVSLSALSQNNGTISGLTPSQFTSSNLFNLGLQIGPFNVTTINQKTGETESIPRQGMDKVKSSKFYQRLALNALFTQRAGQILSSEIPKETLSKSRSSLQGGLNLIHETAARDDSASLPL
jgi:hypothetical protein